MNNKYFICLIFALILPVAAAAQNSGERGFTSLFDGKTLHGWKLIEGKGPGYVVQKGVLVCPENGGGNLLSEKEYSDFILRLDFKLSPGGNNGIALRAPNANGDLTYSGNEVQVLDDPAPMYKDILPAQHCGSLYGVFPAKTGALKRTGEWNSYEITVAGRKIQVKLNGQVVVDGNLNDVTDSTILRTHPGLQRAKGHVGFLGHDAHVEFRNIRIKELVSSATGKK